ncbi:MAG: PqqD family protein [Solirubrobacterales bacterium]
MSDNAISAGGTTTEMKVVVPQHVVYRRFPSETVVLNLQTGKYHGLNPTAGEMLEELARSGSVETASVVVARAHGLAADTVEDDVRHLCSVLLERDLIELADAV